MPFNISEFTSQINRVGLAKNNLFVVQITLPTTLSILDQNDVDSRTLTFLCRTVEIPDFEIGTTDFKPRGFGPSEKRPTSFDYTDLSTVFMVDSDFGVLKFFHRWMQSIVNYDVEGGYQSSNPLSATLPYEFGYKEDYVATMNVVLYSGNSESNRYVYKFRNIFPTSIGSISSAWENQAEVMTLPVRFSYDEMKVDGSQTGTVNPIRNTTNDLLLYLSTLNTYGQAISGLERPNNLQDAINTFTDVSTILDNL